MSAGDRSDDGPAADGDDRSLGLDLRYHLGERDGRPLLTASFSPKAHHRGAPAFLHGGIAATVLDETMAAVGFALDRAHTVTATLNLRYRRPVPLDATPLTIEAWRDRSEARRHQKVHGRIVLPDGSVAVEATGIFVRTVLGS